MTVPGEMIVFDSIAQSNIPRQQKSAALRILDEVSGGQVAQRIGERGRSALTALSAPVHGPIREGVESAGIGVVLGAISAARADGLDVKTSMGVKIPIDAVVGVLGLLAHGLSSNPRISQDGRTAGNVGLGIYGYRMGSRLTNMLGYAATPTKTSSIAGESAEDPIVSKAESL